MEAREVDVAAVDGREDAEEGREEAEDAGRRRGADAQVIAEAPGGREDFAVTSFLYKIWFSLAIRSSSFFLLIAKVDRGFILDDGEDPCRQLELTTELR